MVTVLDAAVHVGSKLLDGVPDTLDSFLGPVVEPRHDVWNGVVGDYRDC